MLPRVRQVSSGLADDFADDEPAQSILRPAPILTTGWERIDKASDQTTRRFEFTNLSRDATLALADMVHLHRGLRARATVGSRHLGVVVLTAFAEFDDCCPVPDDHSAFSDVIGGAVTFHCAGHPDAIDTMRHHLRPALEAIAKSLLAETVKGFA